MTTPEAIRRRQYRISFALGFMLVLLTGLIVAGVIELGQRDRALRATNERLEREIAQRCVDAKANRDGIRATIAGSLENLGYRLDETGELRETPRGPLSYYRDRPAERERVLDQVLTALRETFPPIECNTTREEP